MGVDLRDQRHIAGDVVLDLGFFDPQWFQQLESSRDDMVASGSDQDVVEPSAQFPALELRATQTDAPLGS